MCRDAFHHMPSHNWFCFHQPKAFEANNSFRLKVSIVPTKHIDSSILAFHFNSMNDCAARHTQRIAFHSVECLPFVTIENGNKKNKQIASNWNGAANERHNELEVVPSQQTWDYRHKRHRREMNTKRNEAERTNTWRIRLTICLLTRTRTIRVINKHVTRVCWLHPIRGCSSKYGKWIRMKSTECVTCSCCPLKSNFNCLRVNNEISRSVKTLTKSMPRFTILLPSIDGTRSHRIDGDIKMNFHFFFLWLRSLVTIFCVAWVRWWTFVVGIMCRRDEKERERMRQK